MNQFQGNKLDSMLRWSAMCSFLAFTMVNAQEQTEQTESEAEKLTVAQQQIEELIVMGQNSESETDVESERILLDVQAEFVDSEFIARVGDSDAAALLRRVPGLTLAQGKFVYVRGLGERYSSAQLNGSSVPSPDITRNVIPLDIFPADIIDSMKVQKGYSPELSASFGGGNVDIRTKRVPETGLFHVEFKTGTNSGSGDSLRYPGGGDDAFGVDDGTRALSPMIFQAIDSYRGSLSPVTILRSAANGQSIGSIDVAKDANRQLATMLNRSLDFTAHQTALDIQGELLAGYRYYITDRFDIGFLALGSYSNDERNRDRIVRRFSNPTTDFAESLRTTHEVNITSSLNFGIRFTDDHELGSILLLLRNTEDDATSTRTCSQGQFNDCFDESSPVQGRIFDMRYEQREMLMHQFNGKHTIGDETLDWLPEFMELARDANIAWYYTFATAETALPHEVSISGQERLLGPNGEAINFSVRTTATSGEFRYSNLSDEIETFGWDMTLPFFQGSMSVEFSGGYDYLYKSRNYRQTSLGLGSSIPGFNAISSNSPSEVFSDANILNPRYGMELIVGIGAFGSESYIADQVVEAGYGKIDVLIDETWRLSGGVRSEFFEQTVLPVDYLQYDSRRLDVDGYSRLETEDVYPSAALTYIRPGLWADEFQLRAGISHTVARPDIREMSASTYIDPLTEARVRGNPNLIVSDLTNLDLRGEWFWSNNDLFSVSLFFKDIANPIETVQGGATEDNIRFNFVNADNAEVFGVEIEWKKTLDFLSEWGEWTDTLYFAGNTTLSDSEIYIPVGHGVGDITNERRAMTQQSPWVLNLQVGFDALNLKHSGTVVYNAFGKRVFFAGISGQPDGYEQPFNSLDFVYTYYPTENLSFKLRVRNILGSFVEVTQGDVSLIEQNVGTSVLLNAKWEL
ncbi:MAG: TonB-dependent receptor plug domain-containing protein [Gammaproteobacteria bacterium]|nr:TonB-dependent receptor plug domain-containing protein [Gammaproteobacteria bacterium]